MRKKYFTEKARLQARRRYRAKYDQAHRDQIRAYRKRYNKEHKDVAQRYWKRNRDRLAKKVRSWQKKNKGRLQDLKHRWYMEHREETIAAVQRYYRKHRDEMCRKSREKRKKLTKKRRALLATWMKGGCSRCGFSDIRALEFHHPKRDGRGNSPHTYLLGPLPILKQKMKKCVILCANCHRIVHTRDRRKYRAKR